MTFRDHYLLKNDSVQNRMGDCFSLSASEV